MVWYVSLVQKVKTSEEGAYSSYQRPLVLTDFKQSGVRNIPWRDFFQRKFKRCESLFRLRLQHHRSLVCSGWWHSSCHFSGGNSRTWPYAPVKDICNSSHREIPDEPSQPFIIRVTSLYVSLRLFWLQFVSFKIEAGGHTNIGSTPCHLAAWRSHCKQYDTCSM